jgi:tRNA-dihydrouridine synthase
MHIGLAPMDGITDMAYRIITKQLFEKHGSSDDTLMLWTEFMSAE